VLRPVDFTILFFQRDLVVVMIFEHTYARESNGIHLLIIPRLFFEWWTYSFLLENL